MNKKRIRQMTASLLRRVTTQPAARYLAPHQIGRASCRERV